MTISDMPDDYPWLPGSSRFPIADLGELAARLNSPVKYDRRGEVLWMDRGDHGLAPWLSASYGTGGGVQMVTASTYESASAIELKAGSDGLEAAQVVKYFSPALQSDLGVEVAFACTTEFEYFQLALRRFYDSVQYEAKIHVDQTSSELQYQDSGSTMVKIADLIDPVSTFGIYQFLKLVVDFEQEGYVRVLYNQVEHDLELVAVETSVGTAVDQYRANALLKGRGGQNDVCLIGQMIITGNEP